MLAWFLLNPESAYEQDITVSEDIGDLFLHREEFVNAAQIYMTCGIPDKVISSLLRICQQPPYIRILLGYIFRIQHPVDFSDLIRQAREVQPMSVVLELCRKIHADSILDTDTILHALNISAQGTGEESLQMLN